MQQKSLPTPYEQGDGNTTATYQEALDFYMNLAREYSEINIQTLGPTDSGQPLHLVTFNPEGNFNFQRLGEDKVVVLILNGIHPGESDGIDASMMLMRDLATGSIKIPKNVIPAVIPVYNIGGALQRNTSSRANQNGPESYGFRGNARNFDLNRDFMKMDTKNAISFAEIFHLVNPDFFVDTHVSNGADYSYTLTHLFTQQDKLGGAVGKFQDAIFRPELEAKLQESGWDITPYVNVFNRSPESGFNQFMDSPRYSTGFTSLWSTPGLMIETHMLKPYAQRVSATYDCLLSILNTMGTHEKALLEARRSDNSRFKSGDFYPLAWTVDTTQKRTLNFKGFEAEYPVSEVTGLPGLRYNRNRPYTREISYFDSFIPADYIQIPKGYWVPKAWNEVRDRMDINKIKYTILDKDSTVQVTSYQIANFSTYSTPYEGHYPHYNTQVQADTTMVTFHQGDLFVSTDQEGVRYILETLEPAATDSFFNWNFFDTVLQRKEGFSPYVFDAVAQKLLESDSLLNQSFNRKKEVKPDFAANSYAQLDWIYRNSPHYERAHMHYPIYRAE
ncbi:M14 family metallopeptidase [Robiginitalea sp.]|nr:M14 family metallopeptidase [Robiginitalea sp.]